MSNVGVFEIAPGHAAPSGSTLVHHNGRQYAVTDGTWTGGTFIPSTNSMPYPTAPAQDLSPIYTRIDALTAELASMRAALVEYAEKVDLIFKGREELAEELNDWSTKLGEALDDRFAEISQALRLLLDE